MTLSTAQQKPTEAMGEIQSLRPLHECESKLSDKILKGITDISNLINEGLRSDYDCRMTMQSRVNDLIAGNKGLTFIETLNNPSSALLQNALSILIGNPETPAMRDLRATLHTVDGGAIDKKRMIKYLMDQGLRGRDLYQVYKPLVKSRNIIMNHANLRTVFQDRRRTSCVPH